ncbi:MAG: NAD(+)/NADH kinase, partial [Dokdonella sp.]
MTGKIAFVASPTAEAQAALAALTARHRDSPLDQAEVIVALGGDGFMLRTLHRHIPHGLPVYGMKLGTVGFLMNQYSADDLPDRLARAQPTSLRPLL